MNDASGWRLALAEQFARAYTALPQVRAVLVTGSVARGLADAYSDVELTVFWESDPDEATLREAALRGGGTPHAFYGYEEENGDWSEDVDVRGVEFAVSHRTVVAVEGWLADVVEDFDTSLVKQDLIAMIQYGRPLSGHDLIATWRATVEPYPPALAAAMVREHLGFRSRWQRAKLLARGERLLLYEDFCAAERAILLTLLGLNRVYLPHLGFKWMDQVIPSLRLAPPDLAFRLRQVFEAPAADAVTVLDALIEEVFVLVATHLPAVDTQEAWGTFTATRPVWPAPPPITD